ncbi:MAG TPA: hypothetical protein VND98_01460 [Solirubrobacterales bacterium]|nr:hypothetical protein [Solirubrobacterales bacterium]
MPPRRASAAGLVFALLVLSTVAAFAWSQRLKRDPLLLDQVKFGVHGLPFEPSGSCGARRERIEFRITTTDHATVQVIRPGGALVLTLARDRYLPRYNYYTFYWDGRDRAGALAPAGRYKLRVRLLGQERILVPPGTIRLLAPTIACPRVMKGSA